jgi:iron complex outermembrane receptor protein
LQSVASAHGIGKAPRDVARLNLSGPLPGARVTAAVETQYTASRETSLGEVGGLGVANLTLRYRARSVPVELSAWTYNLFDRRYADPIGFDRGMAPGDPFEQGGRTVGLQAVLWL